MQDITGQAVNIDPNPVTFSVARRALVHQRNKDGTISQVQGQVYIPTTVQPGEVIDVGAYAHQRADNPGMNDDVPTVIERRTAGKIVPLWKPRAKAHRERAEARQQAAHARETARAAAMETALEAANEGLAKRKLDAGMVELCMLAYGNRITIGEDNETARVEWPPSHNDGTLRSLPLTEGLDLMAAEFLSRIEKPTAPPKKSNKK